MNTYTLTEIINAAISSYKEGLVEANSPRNNLGDAEQLYFVGDAYLTFDNMAYHFSTRDWPNTEDNSYDEKERKIIKTAETYRQMLRTELERLWEKENE